MLKYSFLFILFFIIGLFAIIAGIQTWRLNQKTGKFNKTTAKILEKSIGDKKNASSSGPKARYRVNVLYEYDWKGNIFKGQNYYSMELIGGEQAMSKQEVQKILDSLDVETEVFVNPENPEECFLVRNTSLHWLFFGAGVVVFLSGFLIFGVKILSIILK